MKHACLALSLLLVTSLPLRPEAQQPQGRRSTGHELLRDCTLYFSFLGRTGAGRAETFEEDPFGMGYCAGLVRGVAQSADAFHPEIVCRLDGVTTDRAILAVVQYLNDHPASRDQADSVLVLRALQDAFICGAG